MEEIELETLKRVDWFNNRRLLEPIGNRGGRGISNQLLRWIA